MHIAHTRRGLMLAAPLLAALALLVASPARAAIDCDLSPNAPICNRGEDPGGDAGGGESGAPNPNLITASQQDEVAPGDFVSTYATVDTKALMMYATTRVWTTNLFWGFHGCVEFDLLTAYGTVATHSQKVCQGVDGVSFGVFERTTSVTWHVYPYPPTASIRIIHSAV